MVNALITKEYDVDRIENIVIGYEMAKDDWITINQLRTPLVFPI